MALRRKILIDLYTYSSRRVYLYSPKYLIRFLRPFTLERREYDIYAKTALIALETIKGLEYKRMVVLRVRPWFFWFWRAFLKGGFKSPVVVVQGKLVSSGKIPKLTDFEEEIEKAHRKLKFLQD